jgi:chromatin segregation and condensation protein Rec8/ScpA/Scc1 (kleisin family)
MFAAMRSRQEIACTFLALLELIRLSQARAVQRETYGEIFIERAEGVVELVPPVVDQAAPEPRGKE